MNGRTRFRVRPFCCVAAECILLGLGMGPWKLLSNRFGITNEIESNTSRERTPMATTVTSKGQVTIPKQVREAMGIEPGSKVTFELNKDGERVLRKCGPARKRSADRFEAVLGTADIKWRTDELMALLRGDD